MRWDDWMRGFKVGDTVRIAYNGVRDNTLFANIFNGEICTVTDASRITVLVTSKAIREFMHEREIDRTDIGCDPVYLIPFIIEEEDIDATYDVLM